MKIYSIYNKKFKQYGKILEGYDTTELMEALKATPAGDAVVYTAEDPNLQNLSFTETASCQIYGGMPVQMGWCNGKNRKLNCLEYHRDSEVNFGTEDFILLLGKQEEIEEDFKDKYNYSLTDTFMGFHCGNTPECKMCSDRAVKYQLIQHRLLEPEGSDPDFTRGTLEGDIAASDITFFRLQCDANGDLRSYIAEGEILDVPTRSFGGIGIFAIHEMGRFYRHVLIQKGYPHHGAVAFSHVGKKLFEVFKYLGIQDIAYNQPKSLPYPTENPWA